MNMKLETLPPYRIVFTRQVGPYGDGNRKTMEEIKNWAKEKQWLTSAIFLGIAQDNPETTKPEQCRFDACLVVPNDYQMPREEGFYEVTLPGGLYLVFQVQHTKEALQKAWTEIFPAVYQNGYEVDSKPVIERYTGESGKDDICELCVPVK